MSQIITQCLHRRVPFTLRTVQFHQQVPSKLAFHSCQDRAHIKAVFTSRSPFSAHFHQAHLVSASTENPGPVHQASGQTVKKEAVGERKSQKYLEALLPG